MWIMAAMKKCLAILKKMKQKVLFRIALWKMDDMWRSAGGKCWELFPRLFTIRIRKKK